MRGKAPTKIIAEIGVNHNGSMALAQDMIVAAKECGADAVKFQSFTAETLVTRNTSKAAYQKQQTDAEESQFDMLKALELSVEDHEMLIDACARENIEFLSTPFDQTRMQLLVDQFGLKTLKIGSGDLTNAPLLYAAARRNVDLILSTGMSTLNDIEEALSVVCLGYAQNAPDVPQPHDFQQAWSDPTLRQKMHDKVTLLHCTSNYPAPPENINLLAMSTLRQAFGTQVGYSDHSEGAAVSVAAVALGAVMIEKHITLDKTLPGPDHQASITPDELKSLVEQIRLVDTALGSSVKFPTQDEYDTIHVARKSLIALKDIEKGDVFTEKNLGVKRPGTGIRPSQWWQKLGQKAQKDYKEEDII